MQQFLFLGEKNQLVLTQLSSSYLITRSYPVDDVFQVSHHLLIPEVGRERVCPLRQQLQDLGTKLAHFCLLLSK